jgi:hypothetical protein
MKIEDSGDGLCRPLLLELNFQVPVKLGVAINFPFVNRHASESNDSTIPYFACRSHICEALAYGAAAIVKAAY